MDLRYRNLLQWYSLVISLPVVLFSAMPFYRTALGGLRAGVLHIDFPIVLALLAAFAISVWKTVFSQQGVYYDSVTAVIFLLLIARYIQAKIVEKIAGNSALISSLVPLYARLIDRDHKEISVYSGSLKHSQLVRFSAGEVLSVDGTVTQGNGFTNISFLTGESQPQPVSQGSKVYAGTVLTEGDLVVRVEAIGTATRIGRLMLDVQRNATTRPQIELFLDRRSRGFTALVVIAALGTWLYWGAIDGAMAIERTIALLLVTCPCVLALATPIVFSVSMVRAARRGILFRTSEAIERIETIRQVLFDKTGTLTTGVMSVKAVYKISHDQLSLLSNDQINRIDDFTLLYQIELGIEHPIASAIREYLRANSSVSKRSQIKIEAVEGKGIRATSEGAESILIGSPSWEAITSRITDKGAQVIDELLEGGDSAIVFSPAFANSYLLILGDAVRVESKNVISFFNQRKFEVAIISGDQKVTTDAIGKQLGISTEKCFAPCTPEDKRHKVTELQPRGSIAVVGDGINDVAALSAATLGIGIIGGAEASLKIADVYLSEGTIEKLPMLFTGSLKVMRSVRLSLCISACYNVLGAAGAFWGVIGPLEAAIIMPISSLTSILLASTRRTF